MFSKRKSGGFGLPAHPIGLTEILEILFSVASTEFLPEKDFRQPFFIIKFLYIIFQRLHTVQYIGLLSRRKIFFQIYRLFS